MGVDLHGRSADASRPVQARLQICVAVVTQFVTHFGATTSPGPSSLAVSQPRWDATTSWSRTPRRRRANGPRWGDCTWLLATVGPFAAKGSREPS